MAPTATVVYRVERLTQQDSKTNKLMISLGFTPDLTAPRFDGPDHGAGRTDRVFLFTATKTQFAEIETHVWIIGLLRYLKKRYLHDLEVKDGGEYWETENLEKLREKKQCLQGMINQLAGTLNEAEPLPEGATLDDIVDRIEQIAKGRKAIDANQINRFPAQAQIAQLLEACPLKHHRELELINACLASCYQQVTSDDTALEKFFQLDEALSEDTKRNELQDRLYHF